MESWVITLFFVLPFFCAFVNPLADRIFPGVQRVLTTVMTFALLILTIFVCFYHQQTIVYAVGGWKPVGSVPIGIHLVLDGLSGFMLLMINLIGFFSAFYAIDYMKEYTGGKYFYVLICLMIAGMNGVVLSGDLFNMYVFMELAAKSSYALVAFGLRKDELEASFKYQVLGGMASLLILFGITMLYWKTSTLNMADISNLLQNSDNDAFILFVQLILITGFGVKSALIPFHG